MTNQTAHVLVVDDQDAGRFVKVQMLRRAGFTTYEASTGRDALEIVRTKSIDLLVLDVNLPDISGLEVSRIIREQQPGPPSTPILHFSSTAVADSDRAQGLNSGADAYLPEPVDASVLLATVRALMRVRRAEQSLAEALTREKLARSEAEKANREKDDFIATLSHELRTPLNALMGWIFQLRQTSLTKSARRRALDSLERNTRVQAQLINDLLELSRVTKGKLQLQVRAVNMATIATEAAESIRAVAQQKGLELEVQTVPVTVAGDESRLQQIAGNLLNNAIQFTAPGGRILLSLMRQQGEAILRVSDTGTGIDSEFLPYVFEPFRQGKDGLARRHGGLGLGLAVVHQLVELHDGTVSVASDGPGRGTTFAVRLPEMPVSPDRGEESTLLLAGFEVLLISDTPDEQETLAAMLEASGARVTLQNAVQGSPRDGDARVVDVVVRERLEDVMICPANGASSGGEIRIASPVRPAALVRGVATFGPPRQACT